jgi:hypothetical protein
MKRGDGEYGLWLNILHFIKLTGWNQSQIAQLMYPYTDGITLEQLQGFLRTVIYRHSKRWKYSAAFAEAFGLPELTCVAEDLREYPTLQHLHRVFHFNRMDVLKRSEEKRKMKWVSPSGSDELFAQFYHELERDLLKGMERWAKPGPDGNTKED